MKKIDHRKNYHITIDTETAPLDKECQAVDPYNMFVYDVGICVHDNNHNVYETLSFVNADIFLNEKALMKSAYYKDKIPQYWEDIKNGTRILAPLSKIRRTILELQKEYNADILAYNSRFDYGALNNTIRWETKSKYRWFLPFGLKITDTLAMARKIIAPMPSYQKFCFDNGYLTKNDRPKLNAEIVYRFISGDNEFIESHTGLEDCFIEKEIYCYCFKRKTKDNAYLFERQACRPAVVPFLGHQEKVY